MSLMEKPKAWLTKDRSPSAWLFSKADTAKHAPTRGAAATLAVPVVLVEYPARIVGGTLGAVKRAVEEVSPSENSSKGPSSWLFKKAGSAEHGGTRVVAGITGAVAVLVELPVRVAVGTAGAVYRATERVTRKQ